MRPLTLSLCVLLLTAGATAVRAQPQSRPLAAFVDDRRIDRVEQWMKAIARHEPGSADAAATEVGAWATGDLQTLWIDVDVLIKLMRHPGMARFTMKTPGQRTLQEIRYTAAQLRRLRSLACVTVGIVAEATVHWGTGCLTRTSSSTTCSIRRTSATRARLSMARRLSISASRTSWC
jgi:hypothetical protein